MATLRLALRVKAALLLLLFPAEDDEEEGEEAARCVVWKLLDISISPNNDDNNKLK
jgi:hypothetical protein